MIDINYKDAGGMIEEGKNKQKDSGKNETRKKKNVLLLLNNW